MALPTLSETQVEDIYVTTINRKLPDIVDNVYNSNPVLAILNARKQIKLDGGKQIEQGIIYGKLNGGFYGRGSTFNTDTVNTKTAFILDWKRAYVNITIEGLEDLQNAGASAVFSHASQKTEEAEFKLKDILGGGIFGNSADDGGNAYTGFEEWIDEGDNFATVAGITRGTDTVGTAAKGVYDATGASWTIPVLQTQYGEATVENEKPDLIVTTQTLWNALSNRVQPQQRYPAQGTSGAQLAAIGFEALQYQRAAVTVDSHCQSGRSYGLNLKYWKFVVHSKRPGTKIRGWMPTTNKDERVTQILHAGNLVCSSPRLNFQQRSLTA